MDKRSEVIRVITQEVENAVDGSVTSLLNEIETDVCDIKCMVQDIINSVGDEDIHDVYASLVVLANKLY